MRRPCLETAGVGRPARPAKTPEREISKVQPCIRSSFRLSPWLRALLSRCARSAEPQTRRAKILLRAVWKITLCKVTEICKSGPVQRKTAKGNYKTWIHELNKLCLKSVRTRGAQELIVKPIQITDTKCRISFLNFEQTIPFLLVKHINIATICC